MILYSYLSYLAGLSIGSPLDLVGTPFSEPDAEHPQSVVISGFHINMSFNQSLPFPHQRPQLVIGKIHSLQHLRRGLELAMLN
jgi:hypothetical protein